MPDLNSLPEDIRTRILAVQEKAGFIPNVFLTLAYKPNEFRAFFDYHDAIMEREGSTLSAAEKEMIVVPAVPKMAVSTVSLLMVRCCVSILKPLCWQIRSQ